MTRLLLIGIGGGAGSILRFVVGGYVQGLSGSLFFPYGTLVVNVVGCFVIGFLTHLAETHGNFTPEARALIFVGVLGGFTTFSTFGNEAVILVRDAAFASALAYVGTHVVLGLGAVWVGRAVAAMLWS